ncbi:hypothetical protein [Psychroserpens sp. MEBiC05023]
MDKSFKLNPNQPFSNLCVHKGLDNFLSVFNYVKQLPYGRPSDRSNYSLVLSESKGTCSTKHAFLKAIAIENNFEDLNLCLGIFKMNAENTPKIKQILEQHQLDYIPEAHCYLKYQGDIIDITFESENTSFHDVLLYEEVILPDQIGAYKVRLHQAYLKSWITKDNLLLNFENIWAIREACILKISE